MREGLAVEVWDRIAIPGDRDPAVEVNLPFVSIRSSWPFLYWHRDRWYPWSVHVHLPGLRILSMSWRAYAPSH